LTSDCCISETAFPLKSIIIGLGNWMGLAAEMPKEKRPGYYRANKLES